MANKTDRELLKAVAKAAGIEVNGLADKFVAQHDLGKDALCIRNNKGGDSLWNPLTDDGDALRLAVKLVLEIDICLSNVAVRTACGHKIIVDADEVKDIYAATRRAIVRAAAEIGEQQRGER